MCIDRRFGYSCGKCVECVLEKSREWQVRITLEAQQYKDNCLITLTYSDEFLPGILLQKPDLQKFIKRLRKFLEPHKIRYFACGEYGKKNNRPHFHIIIFGWKPDDLRFFFRDKKGSNLYLSSTISKLWTFGYHTVGEVNFQSAKYVAKYLQKPTKDKLLNPFFLMSRKPGIGFNEISNVIENKGIVYLNGKTFPTPRYFFKKLLQDDKTYEDALLLWSELKKKKRRDLTIDELRNKIEKYKKNFPFFFEN